MNCWGWLVLGVKYWILTKCLLGVDALRLFSPPVSPAFSIWAPLLYFPSVSDRWFGGVGGGFTTSYAASSVHTLTAQPCVHQEGLLLQYICLLHQNNS